MPKARVKRDQTAGYIDAIKGGKSEPPKRETMSERMARGYK